MKISLFSKITLFCLFVFLSCTQEKPKQEDETQKIAEMMKDYRQAWINNNPSEVLKYLSDDIILFNPTKTGKPIKSKDSVSEFWFPETNVKYPIISYKVENEAVVYDCNLAYYQGITRLKWCILENGIYKDTTFSVSEFTDILKKVNDQWKLHRIMYVLKDKEYNN